MAGCFEMRKRRLAIFCLALTTIPSVWATVGQNSLPAVQIHKIYLGSLGSKPDALYLQDRLRRELTKTRGIFVVDDLALADVVLTGTATMPLLGYYCPNPRIRYRDSSCVAVHDAKMTLELEDPQGLRLWSGSLKPRFWGSQYVSDNVVNQAARNIAEVLRLQNEQRNPSPDRR